MSHAVTSRIQDRQQPRDTRSLRPDRLRLALHLLLLLPIPLLRASEINKPPESHYL